MNEQKFLPPTYYENFVIYDNEEYFKDLIEIEWRGQIKSSTENKKFKIRYYGEILKEYNLIVGTEFSEALIFAEDIETKEQILLFDGCKHGYNAMLCDENTAEQISNRPLKNTYVDKNGFDTFEVVISVYNGIPYDEELKDFQNENGDVELISGEVISSESLVRNGFDFISLKIFNERGEVSIIVEEELA